MRGIFENLMTECDRASFFYVLYLLWGQAFCHLITVILITVGMINQPPYQAILYHIGKVSVQFWGSVWYRGQIDLNRMEVLCYTIWYCLPYVGATMAKREKGLQILCQYGVCNILYRYDRWSWYSKPCRSAISLFHYESCSDHWTLYLWDLKLKIKSSELLQFVTTMGATHSYPTQTVG